MDQVLLLALRGVCGGLLVVVFAAIAEVLKPKMFSGLFSAAPSIAIASLLITAFTKKPNVAAMDAAGMSVGALGMVACTLVAAYCTDRLGAIAGTALAWLAWAAVAGLMYWLFFR